MSRVLLRAGAWYGDREMEIEFPPGWEVEVRAGDSLPALPDADLPSRLRNPLGAAPLRAQAGGARHAAVVIDDLSRPTPTAGLISAVVAELVAGGLSREAITVVLAGGTHQSASAEDIRKKVGEENLAAVRVVAHDMRRSDLVDLGKTERGTPVQVNRELMGADLKIGVGGVFPHPAAGYSGGSKIVVPGACGFETASRLHDLSHAPRGNLESEMRREIDAIGRRIGLDFVVNVLINHQRQVSAVFAGDPVEAHLEGVALLRRHFAVPPPGDVEVVVADAYPFDTSFTYVSDRSFWPLTRAPEGTRRVSLAACPEGMGHHALDRSVADRLRHRVKSFRPRDLLRLGERLTNLRRTLGQTRLEFLMWSEGIRHEDLVARYSGARAFSSWTDLAGELARARGSAPTRVQVYRCAPLLLS